jgi:hypothetical protein
MSKIKVNSIEAATGSTITIPSGQTLDISSTTLTLPSDIVTTTGTQTLTNKTIGVSQLSGTLPVANGGTGLTTLGTAEQVLRVNSGATALEFGTVASGKILQLLSTTKTDTQSNSSQSMVAITGLTVTITPRDVNSTFYLIANVNLGASSTNVDGHLQFTRNGTSVIIADTAGNRSRDTWNGGDDAIRSTFVSIGVPITGLDSPATTSAITYGIKYGSLEGANALYVNRTGSDADALRDGRGTSTITVMEIAN